MKTQNSVFKKWCYLTLMSALVFSSVKLSAQEEKRDVSGFNSVSYALPGTLEIVQGTKESLMIKGDKEDIEKVITRVEGNELKIYTKSHESNLSDIHILVTVVQLEELSVAGSGDVNINDVLKSDKFELSLSGSGNVNCDRLEASELELSLAGSGDVTIAGKVNEIELSIAGSGDVEASELESKDAEVSIAGSGSVKVWATDKLESSIVGSGDVYYKGRPLVESKTIGSGSTKPL